MPNIIVGISDLKATKSPDILVTYALGSCVGICLYDKRTAIAGLSHIMLPDSTAIKDGQKSPMKFADTGIPLLIETMKSQGASPYGLTAKIAGGALMFAANSQKFNIGERNVEAVKKVLQSLRIPIVSQDTGLDYGRTVFFHAQDGKVEIKSAAKGIISI